MRFKGLRRPKAAPEERAVRTDRLSEGLIEASNGDTLRGLAESILQDQLGRGRRGLALCGAAAGAGVTTTTASLGLTLARAGVKVLLVEANLRSPSLSDFISPSDAARPGLTQFLTGEVSDFTALIDEPWPNVSAIYAGAERPHVEDLFDTDRFEDLIRIALRTYDMTLVDTPPANRCAETRRIAGVVGYAAVIARRNTTMADDMKTLVTDLRKSRTDVVGAILNEG